MRQINTTVQKMNLLIILLIVAAVAAVAYKKKKKDKAQPDTAPVPDWFDGSEYLRLNPDVAEQGLDPWLHYVDYGRLEGRQPYDGVDGSVSEVNPDIPTGRWIYMDDFVRSLTAEKGGDFNAPNDLAFVLAMAVEQNSLPMAIICTSVGHNRGIGLEAAKKVVEESGLGIPVLAGNTNYRKGDSEGSRFIAQESKKGKLTICIGGPCNDIRDAGQVHGANANNINFFAIVKGTWNQWTNSDTKGETELATDYMYSRFQKIRDIADYRGWLQAPKGIPFNESWVKEWRDKSRVFRLCFGNFVNERNRQMNAMQGNGRNPMRAADFMTVAAMFGLDYNNFGHMIGVFERGFSKMEEYPKAALRAVTVGVVEQAPEITRKNYTKADYDRLPHKVTYGVDTRSWSKTSNLTSASISSGHTTVKHSKSKSWAGKALSDGKTIVNANLWLVFIENNQVIHYPFEHLRPGQSQKHVGWQSVYSQSRGQHDPKLKKGDLIGIYVTTQARVGTAANGKERSNIVWTTAK